MIGRARNHHYLPQCYLRGFTKGYSKKSKLHVFDLTDLKQFETKPQNVATVRDFNTIFVNEEPSDALENSFAQLESQFSKMLKKLRASPKLPDGEDFNLLLNLAALIHIRNPGNRNLLIDFNRRIMKQVGDLLFTDKDVYESTRKRMQEEADAIEDSCSFEEIRDFHLSGKYSLKFSNEHLIDLEMTGIDAVLKTFINRSWILIYSPKNNFICGDYPAMLTWTDVVKSRMPPGHNMQHTEFVFPVSKSLVLLGTYENESGEYLATDEMVANVNAMSLAYARRQVYCSNKDFPVFTKERTVTQFSKIKDEFQRDESSANVDKGWY